MRPIKFRVWLDEFNKMFYDVGLMGGELYVNIDGKGYDVVGDCRDFKLMQYTGLKDGYGNEIFEGDILEDFINKKRYEVIWDEYGLFVFNPVGTKGYAIDYYEFEDEASTAGTMVIGNIHEHPHLLEGEE